MIAIGSGGPFGVGLGESVQKLFYLPEAHTDMILAVIGEELGFVGIAVVLFLYGMIAYAGLRAARTARDLYAKLLAAGITSVILIQATVNFFAVLGVLPLTGVPLPFISYGNSNLVVLLAGMGILINVAQTAARGASRSCAWSRTARASKAARQPARGIRKCTMPTIVIAAGGTAGHVVPALAVADELRASGARGRLRRHARACRGRARAARRLRDRVPLGRAASTAATRCAPARAALQAAARGAGRARGCCARVGADAVLGGGGYVAGPVGLAAALLRIPLVLTEADSHLGLANRAAGAVRAARLPGVPDRRPRRASATSSPAARCRARSLRRRPRRSARARLGIARRTRAACSSSAAASARASLNEAAFEAFARRRRRRDVRARRRPARLRRSWRRASPSSGDPPHYRLFEYVETLGRPARRERPGARAGRRLGVRDRRRRAGRRCWSRTRTRPPTTRTRTRAGWPTPAPRS